MRSFFSGDQIMITPFSWSFRSSKTSCCRKLNEKKFFNHFDWLRMTQFFGFERIDNYHLNFYKTYLFDNRSDWKLVETSKILGFPLNRKFRIWFFPKASKLIIVKPMKAHYFDLNFSTLSVPESFSVWSPFWLVRNKRGLFRGQSVG